jgi:hypothetical protein
LSHQENNGDEVDRHKTKPIQENNRDGADMHKTKLAVAV